MAEELHWFTPQELDELVRSRTGRGLDLDYLGQFDLLSFTQRRLAQLLEMARCSTASSRTSTC